MLLAEHDDDQDVGEEGHGQLLGGHENVRHSTVLVVYVVQPQARS